ncbi:MAG: prolipoprotein diacylglyceryl transferase [Burkholderiaceae bacterium]
MPMVHPNFDPIAFAIGPVAVRWYGLMYVIAFALFYLLGRLRLKQAGFTTQALDDILFYGALGVILGGRLGYVLFYKPAYYLQHPLEAFYIWQGGMSFHGGLLGVIFAMWLYGRMRKLHFLTVMDFVAPLVPTGLAAGRMGNFINGELWGRATDPAAPWAMIFPQARDNIARHPSQLYQFALEGVLLFIVIWIFSSKPRPRGAVAAAFTLGYGICRFIAEFAREPDNFLGLLALNLSMGQWLSIPMILIGGAVLWWSYKQAPAKP